MRPTSPKLLNYDGDRLRFPPELLTSPAQLPKLRSRGRSRSFMTDPGVGTGVHELEPACPPVRGDQSWYQRRPTPVHSARRQSPLLITSSRFRREGRTGRAVGSIVTSVAFLAGFVGVASGFASPAITLTFTGAVLLVWLWLSSTSVHLYAPSLNRSLQTRMHVSSADSATLLLVAARMFPWRHG
jgi:hypothetical protein